MKKSIVLISALAALLVSACEVAQKAGVGGDSKPKKLVVGTVDTSMVLHADPEYMPMAQQYMRERTEIQAQFMKEARTINKDDPKAVQAIKAKYADLERKLAERWRMKTEEFLKVRHGQMRDDVAEICKDKKIDMVLIHSKEIATVEWGAVDITQDVLLKTSGGNAPVSTASPRGESK